MSDLLNSLQQKKAFLEESAMNVLSIIIPAETNIETCYGNE